MHNWHLGTILYSPINQNNSAYGRCVLCGHDGLMVIKIGDFINNPTQPSQ